MFKILFFLLLVACLGIGATGTVLTYFENLEVGCFPPSLEDKKKHFLMLSDKELLWNPNNNVTDATFTFKFISPLNEDTVIDYGIAVEKLKRVLPNLRIINFQGIVIQGTFSDNINEFSKWAHQTYQQVLEHAKKLTFLCKSAKYTVARFFFTVIIPRQMCDSYTMYEDCQWLRQRILLEFHDVRSFIVYEDATLVNIKHNIIGTDFQFMINF
ncbi:unnamed protein product [Bursaphelenchus okinawaensis]|uniref:Uncharacterized protein n=1 Tax=Bursaphelenchus okinawaensis TaxID=465554 RepID=A0A811JW43_9BILA|nr:unnamed protein product [Bursaphelenchus okinawaensis]CAG9086420.1 unnamed protein product [Bursaphelenchus okinawaensis]